MLSKLYGYNKGTLMQFVVIDSRLHQRLLVTSIFCVPMNRANPTFPPNIEFHIRVPLASHVQNSTLAGSALWPS